MLLRPFDAANPLHSALAQVELTTLWGLAILALGLSRATGKSMALASSWIFGIWLAMRLLLLGLGYLPQLLASN